MVAVFGQRKAQEHDWFAEDALHGRHRADGATLAREHRFGPETEAIRRTHRVRQGSAGAALERLQARLRVDLHIGKAIHNKRTNSIERLLTRHIRHQPTRQLDLGARRNRRLDTGARVATHHSVHFKGRHRPQATHHLQRVGLAQ